MTRALRVPEILVVDETRPQIPVTTGLVIWTTTESEARSEFAKHGHYERVLIRINGGTEQLRQFFEENGQEVVLVENVREGVRRISEAQHFVRQCA